MTTIKSNGEEWLFFKVPDKATDFKIAENIMGVKFSIKYRVLKSISKWTTSYKGLGDSNYVIHSVSDEIKESQAEEIVERYKDGQHYCYYVSGSKLDGYYCDSAFFAFWSMLRAYDMIDGRFLILKKT